LGQGIAGRLDFWTPRLGLGRALDPPVPEVGDQGERLAPQAQWLAELRLAQAPGAQPATDQQQPVWGEHGELAHRRLVRLEESVVAASAAIERERE